MERSKHFIILISLVFCFTNLYAGYKADIYIAYINSDMKKWNKIIDEMYLQKDKSNAFKLELINYQYGYIAWCIGVEKDDAAEKYLALAEESLKTLERSSYMLSLVNSYKSAFYGYRIGLNKLKAPFIGRKSIECAKLAIKLDNKNPYGYIQYGNSQYYMPAILGGSKTVALEYFKKAEELMELEGDQIKEDWNYLSLLTMIAKAYNEIKNYEFANAYVQKILKVDPNFLWVKNELYPQFIKNKIKR